MMGTQAPDERVRDTLQYAGPSKFHTRGENGVYSTCLGSRDKPLCHQLTSNRWVRTEHVQNVDSPGGDPVRNDQV
jgi:hypothetical protein